VSQNVVNVHSNERMMDCWTVGKLIEWAGGKNADEKTRSKLIRDVFDLSAEIAGPAPSPVERVLAKIAATSWFAFRMHEAQYVSSVTSEGGMTLSQSEHAQRRIDRAHRRLLSTLKTLATVRRLAVPALQINVARQQVNQLNTGGSS
jgi:hypothetical protein